MELMTTTASHAAPTRLPRLMAYPIAVGEGRLARTRDLLAQDVAIVVAGHVSDAVLRGPVGYQKIQSIAAAISAARSRGRTHWSANSCRRLL